MQVATLSRSGTGIWSTHCEAVPDPQLVLWFAGPNEAIRPEYFAGLRELYPTATIVGCTSCGEIYNGDVLEGSAIATAVRFRDARIQTAYIVTPLTDGAAAGRQIAAALPAEELRAVFLLVDGPTMAAPLIRELAAALPPGLPISGGVAAGPESKLPSGLGLNEVPHPVGAVAIGFYGPSLRIGHAAGSGWNPLGPARQITRSRGNVIYELDGQPALDLYLRFIGETLDGARLNALRYPFVFKASADAVQDVIRTLDGFDETERSLSFADEVPPRGIAQMMRSMPQHLVDGGVQAAKHALAQAGGGAALSLIVSCVGRKLVMGQSVTDEIFAIFEELGEQPMVGFFALGEICPHNRSLQCTLFNESVTVTLIGEDD